MRLLNSLVLTLTLLLTLLLSATVASAQRAPSRVPSTTTAEQEAVIRAGVAFHDKGQYDEAIAKYKEVLAKSPTDVTAMFEMAFSYL
ncbi:MAG: tetratricopeptide repeat protein, partial [Vicinamibacterales bacterium]